MLDQIKNEVIRTIMTVRIQTREEVEAAEAAMQAAAAHLENINYQHADFDPTAAPEELMAPLAVTPGTTAMADDPATTYMGMKVGRNDPCPCGSGKKFKACHGKLA
jgi:preprotein translocase subunit SecA